MHMGKPSRFTHKLEIALPCIRARGVNREDRTLLGRARDGDGLDYRLVDAGVIRLNCSPEWTDHNSPHSATHTCRMKT
eukprot:COSAG05_NODE_1695_length_4263_cov_9.673391_1_plen_78_part_00